jgi:hypothetical protein
MTLSSHLQLTQTTSTSQLMFVTNRRNSAVLGFAIMPQFGPAAAVCFPEGEKTDG